MKFFINHFNINVLDLEKSLNFYKKYLGFEEVRRKKASDESFEIVWISDETKTTTLELTWLKSQVAPYNLGDNEFHIAVQTDKYNEAYDFHKKENVICYENPKMGIYFISDPDGYWIEVIPLKKVQK